MGFVTGPGSTPASLLWQRRRWLIDPQRCGSIGCRTHREEYVYLAVDVVDLVPFPCSVATASASPRKAKAALSNRGGLEQRGKQHTHYKGRNALKHNSEPGHLGSCMAYRGGAMQEFSEVRAVASRSSLYQVLAINVAVRGVVEG
jgi:hypothetical protein